MSTKGKIRNLAYNKVGENQYEIVCEAERHSMGNTYYAVIPVGKVRRISKKFDFIVGSGQTADRFPRSEMGRTMKELLEKLADAVGAER